MAITKEQVESYGVSLATSGGSFWTRMAQDIADWSALDLITAAGVVFGIAYGGIRAYRDISELLDRKWADDENDNSG